MGMLNCNQKKILHGIFGKILQTVKIYGYKFIGVIYVNPPVSSATLDSKFWNYYAKTLLQVSQRLEKILSLKTSRIHRANTIYRKQMQYLVPYIANLNCVLHF